MSDTAENLKAAASECAVVAMEISVIAKGVSKLLRDTELNERAVMMLLHHACPPDQQGKKLSRRAIARVLEGIERMPELYLKGDER